MSSAEPPVTRRRPRRAVIALVAIFLVAAAILVAVIAQRRTARPTPGAGTTAALGAGPLAPFRRPSCPVSAILVPSCGRWWGVAPLAHTSTPVRHALATEEALAARPLDIVHVYHTNAQLFPTADERALAVQADHPRLLLINWKPATDHTWREVADGAVDARIDRLGHYIASTFPHRFFLAVWHEPENDVRPAAGSGFTAADYAAMYRHVVDRLRAAGATRAVTVMNYIGFAKWALQPWFAQLWPGDRYVDWVGIDPYGTGAAAGGGPRDLHMLVDRPSGTFPGYYTWATRAHPGKPIMLCEWGVEIDEHDPGGQARFFTSVRDQISRFPAIKALVYFDDPDSSPGHTRIYLGAFPQTVAAYRALGRLPAFTAPTVPA